MINIAADLKDLPAIVKAFPAVCAEQDPNTGAWSVIVPDDISSDVQALVSSPQQMGAALAAYLVALKAKLCAKVDQDAEDLRGRFITMGSGQAMTYQAKAEEARRFPSSGDVEDPSGDFPLLSAEVGITGETLADVAAAVLAANAAWLTAGAGIEAARLGAKRAINAATTMDAVTAAYAGAVWPD